MFADALKMVGRELVPAQEFATRLNELIELELEAAKPGSQEEARG